MQFDDKILKTEEKICFNLRSLYHASGYGHFKMSRFEEYDLYAKNKDFLASSDVLTFTDLSGKLLALKPDVTLSIIKNYSGNAKSTYKVYYDENVYRASHGHSEFHEIMQTGIEYIGNVDIDAECEVIELAIKSLEKISKKFILNIASVGLINALFDRFNVGENLKKDIILLLNAKNSEGIMMLSENGIIDVTLSNILILLSKMHDAPESGLISLRKLSENFDIGDAFSHLEKLMELLGKKNLLNNIKIDFSVINNISYYNGIVFCGYIYGISGTVLSGGRYDRLLERMGKSGGAIGFAVYMDILERFENTEQNESENIINIALPKGRLGEKVYEIFERSGYGCPSIHDNSRKLIFENRKVGVRYFWVKPSDVAIYVERGAADIGVCGKDILLEYSPDVYELCDLNMGKCRMAVAGKNDFSDDPEKTLRVATKFPNIAKKYYGGLSREIDIIKLNGSIEIAPILGLSDVIVDIVETGVTLKENNLELFETIVPISAWLIANKSIYRFKNKSLTYLTEAIKSNQ